MSHEMSIQIQKLHSLLVRKYGGHIKSKVDIMSAQIPFDIKIIQKGFLQREQVHCSPSPDQASPHQLRLLFVFLSPS